MDHPCLSRRTLGGASLAAVAAATWPAAPAHAARTAIGTYGGAGCDGVPEVAAFEKWLGRRMDVVLDFLDMSSWKAMTDEVGWITGCWRGAGRRRLVVSVPMLVGDGKPTLRQCAEGQFDAQFRTVARKLIEAGYANTILRIGWEFNGGWYPWTARDNAAAYAASWRRIVQTMRAMPGASFRFDWNPTTVEGPTEAAYPGDEYADIIGLDIYNQAWPRIESPVHRWDWLLNHPAGLIWHRDFATRRGKPRSFPEWGTGTRPDGHGGGDDPLFVRNMLNWMQQGGPVEYACYWNYRASDYDAKVTDGRLPSAAQALRKGMGGAI